MLFLWIIIFCASLFILIKSADYFTESAEKIGLILKLSPFFVGATIVTFGTTLPELSTAIVAVFQHQNTLAAANAIGSNITNILFIVGLLTIVAGGLKVKRSLVEMELPLLVAATALILVIIWDKHITHGEGVIALLGYLVYAFYTIRNERHVSQKDGIMPGEDIPLTREERHHYRKRYRHFNPKLLVILLLSAFLIYISAEVTVYSIVKIALSLGASVSVIAMFALALGTSLPEATVAIEAFRKGRHDIALGNVFGANIFNILVVIGVPAVITELNIDQSTFSIGIPFLIGATLLYIFSVSLKKITRWEGFMYLLIYALYIIKLFGVF